MNIFTVYFARPVLSLSAKVVIQTSHTFRHSISLHKIANYQYWSYISVQHVSLLSTTAVGICERHAKKEPDCTTKVLDCFDWMGVLPGADPAQMDSTNIKHYVSINILFTFYIFLSIVL